MLAGDVPVAEACCVSNTLGFCSPHITRGHLALHPYPRDGINIVIIDNVHAQNFCIPWIGTESPMATCDEEAEREMLASMPSVDRRLYVHDA